MFWFLTFTSGKDLMPRCGPLCGGRGSAEGSFAIQV